MKLLVITGSVHFDEQIEEILKEAGLNVYSRSDISGRKENQNRNLSDNWFALANAYQDSVMFFAFTQKEKIAGALQAVEDYNETIASESRIRAFVLAVENHV